MDPMDPRRLRWLRSQAISLGTLSEPVSEDRKAWLRRRAVELEAERAAAASAANSED